MSLGAGPRAAPPEPLRARAPARGPARARRTEHASPPPRPRARSHVLRHGGRAGGGRRGRRRERSSRAPVHLLLPWLRCHLQQGLAAVRSPLPAHGRGKPRRLGGRALCDRGVGAALGPRGGPEQAASPPRACQSTAGAASCGWGRVRPGHLPLEQLLSFRGRMFAIMKAAAKGSRGTSTAPDTSSRTPGRSRSSKAQVFTS